MPELDAIDRKLTELGLTLPIRPVPIASFVPFRVVAGVAYLSGQTCEWNGSVLHKGRVGDELDFETAREAAKLCALNLLAALREACGGRLDRVSRCIRVGGFVQASSGYPRVPHVIDGASEVFIALWGERGRHARTAVGVATLPQNAAVEVDAIFELRGAREVVALRANLTKRFGPVLANDRRRRSGEVRAGEVLAVLGENGAGKSTLMKLLYGVVTHLGRRRSARSDGKIVRVSSPRARARRGARLHRHGLSAVQSGPGAERRGEPGARRAGPAVLPLAAGKGGGSRNRDVALARSAYRPGRAGARPRRRSGSGSSSNCRR